MKPAALRIVSTLRHEPSWCQVKERFKKAHEEIKASMAQLYTFFAADPEEVQREWVKFTQKV